MRCYAIDNLYEDINYRVFIDTVSEYADSIYVRVYRMEKDDWLNWGRKEFSDLKDSIITSDSLSNNYAAIHCRTTKEARELLKHYTNEEKTTLYAFGFYKGDERFCVIEESFLVSLNISSQQDALILLLKEAGINLEDYEKKLSNDDEKLIENEIINLKNYSMNFYLKHPELIKDKEFLIRRKNSIWKRIFTTKNN